MYKNPVPTVDIIIEIGDKIVLIERNNEPKGWALPGGFVDYGEPLERAAVREAKEETELDITLTDFLYVYSHPSRDARLHTISAVFIASATGEPRGADDAKEAKLFSLDKLPQTLVFDHAEIIQDYIIYKKENKKVNVQRNLQRTP